MMTEKEKADFDQRVRRALEREPDWKALTRDPFFQWVGVAAFRKRLEQGRFNQLKTIDPIAWACLIDREVREPFVLQTLDDLMRDDKATVIRGLHGLRLIQLAFMPWTLASIPDGLAWALYSKQLAPINEIGLVGISGIERLTDNEFTIWKYFLRRQSHWIRHSAMFETCTNANAISRAWWNLADWSSSDWDETAEKQGWLSWLFDTAHSIAVGGIELVEDLAGITASGVILAAQGVGLIPDQTEVRNSIRWIPDPNMESGLRQVVDAESVPPLARFGEQVITGVGTVDDALRAVGLRKSARIAVMAGGAAIGVVVAAKCLIGAGKLAKWPLTKLWMWYHAPAVPVITGAGAFAAGETLTLAQVALLPASTQAGIASILARGAAHASWLAGLGKVLAGAKGLVKAACSVVGGIVFAKFFLEENDQGNAFIIREALLRQDRDWAVSKLNRHIAQLEKDKNLALIPAVGTLIAADRYIDNAIENRKKTREWLEADIIKWERTKAKIEPGLPVEVKELIDPTAHTKEQKKQILEDETRAEFIATFMNLRRIRIFLGHKRVKAGEDVSIDTANIPLIRTWINRDRAALTTEKDKALAEGKLEDWLQRLRDSGFTTEVLKPSDREIAFGKMGGYKKFKR